MEWERPEGGAFLFAPAYFHLRGSITSELALNTKKNEQAY
jgi:hypothetical protein